MAKPRAVDRRRHGQSLDAPHTCKDSPVCTSLIKSNEFKTVVAASFILNCLKVVSGFQVANIDRQISRKQTSVIADLPSKFRE